MSNAQVSVIDAKGGLLGTASARSVDGAYSMTLNTRTPTGPLLLQARGVDAAGLPQVLHSSVAVPAAAMVANLTPLSDAVVALAMGTDPRTVFANPLGNSSALAGLVNVKAAGEFLKSIIKSQITDLKIANATALDLLGDPSFSADKSASDLLVDSLRVTLGKGNKGEAQLQLANKLAVSLAPEVVIDLAVAKTELAKTTGAVTGAATAITSSAKATASYSKVLALLGPLDEPVAVLNKMIAQGASAAVFTASPALASYTRHDGRVGAELAALLASYSSKNWQLGRFQITGCADDKPIAGTCDRVQVAALVSDHSGKVTDLFNDVLAYTAKPAIGATAWGLMGNGKPVLFSVNPASWLAYQADGTLSTNLGGGPATNPSAGVQLRLQAQSSSGSALLASATVQTPGGFSIPLAGCGQPLLCLSAKAGATAVEANGGLTDTLLQPADVSWVGGADTLRNARYLATFSIGGATDTRSAVMMAEVPTSLPATGRYPALDGVSATRPVSWANPGGGQALTWSVWADDNPGLRMTRLRVVVAQTGQLTVRDAAVLPGVMSLSLPAVTLKPNAKVLSAELWLTAQDSAGRLWLTRYAVQP